MKKVHIFILTLVIIVVGIVLLAVFTSKQTTQKQNPVRVSAVQKVAEALTAAGAKFYGASWCPHCAAQKALFGKSVKSLPYVECSTGGAGTPQTQICIDNKIESYPTWDFAGKRLSAEITPFDLAEMANYQLDDAAKAELSVQKDEYLAELEPAQKESYLAKIQNFKDSLKTK